MSPCRIEAPGAPPLTRPATPIVLMPKYMPHPPCAYPAGALTRGGEILAPAAIEVAASKPARAKKLRRMIMSPCGAPCAAGHYTPIWCADLATLLRNLCL